MTVTTARSAYPPAVTELLPKAQQLVTELGRVPSQNQLKADLRIGAPKAKALHTALTTGVLPEVPDPDESGPVPRSEPVPSVRLASPTPVDRTGPTEVDQAPTVEAFAPVTPVVEPVQPTGEPDTVALASAVPAAPTVTAATVVAARPRRPARSWPVLLLALPAFVAIWSGWVGLGGLTGFGVVHPLPGIADDFQLNTAITLPIGVETYAAYALRAWLSPGLGKRARRFAKVSAIGSLVLGALGQVAYHLMTSAGMTQAPWLVTTAVSCLPVAVVGMGAALAHLQHDITEETAN